MLSTLPAGIFDNLTSLRELYLENNRLSVIQVGQIQQFFYGRAITLNISNQEAPPITLESNVTEEEFNALGLPEEEKECPICHEKEQGNETFLNYKTQCKPIPHRFHAKCLEQWLRSSPSTSCPICRQDVFTGGPSQAMPVAYNLSKQKKSIHLAKQTRRKNKKNHIHIAQRTKKLKVAHA